MGRNHDSTCKTTLLKQVGIKPQPQTRLVWHPMAGYVEQLTEKPHARSARTASNITDHSSPIPIPNNSQLPQNHQTANNGAPIRAHEERPHSPNSKRLIIRQYHTINVLSLINDGVGEKVERPPMWVMRQGEITIPP